MRYFFFIVIFLLLTKPICFAQTPAWEGKFFGKDKAMHFTFSAAFTMLGVETAKDYHAKNPELIGLACGFSIGLAKEFLYDTNQSSRDLLVDFAGCLSGVLVNRAINKQIQKHYKKRGW